MTCPPWKGGAGGGGGRVEVNENIAFAMRAVIRF